MKKYWKVVTSTLLLTVFVFSGVYFASRHIGLSWFVSAVFSLLVTGVYVLLTEPEKKQSKEFNPIMLASFISNGLIGGAIASFMTAIMIRDDMIFASALSFLLTVLGIVFYRMLASQMMKRPS